MARIFNRKFYFELILSVLIGTLLPKVSLARAESISIKADQVVSHVNRVWYGRIHKILEFRVFDLRHCSTSFRQMTLQRFNQMSLDSSDSIALTQLLEFYQHTHSPQIEMNCQMQLDKNENLFWKHETRAFKIPKLIFPMSTVLQELNPHCISRQVPSLNGKYDSNPCLAADEMIGRGLMTDLELWHSQMSQINTELRVRFSERTDKNPSIDLYAVFLSATSTRDTPENRERAIAMVAGALASAPSWSAYFDGITDVVWRDQMKDSRYSLSPREIQKLVEFIPALRLQIDELSQLFKWGRSNVEGMNWQGIDLSDSNHHNMMSAYLACHYRERTALTHEFLPKLMGQIYEAKDFASHLLVDKDSWPIAVQNFTTDTNRYSAGAEWGYRFCKMRL